MANRLKNSWPARRRRAVRLAEELVANNAGPLPVDLSRIAVLRAVQRIEFAPLLTQGGLAVRDDGFVIYVRCDSTQAADLTGRFLRDGTGRTLPRAIAPRARFTVAHEIGHTLFYDIRSLPPRPQIQIDNQDLATKLELTCNQIAGRILMPENLIQKHFPNFEFVRPDQLRALANTTITSVEAVVRRFSHLRTLNHPEAILLSVSRGASGWTITALSKHYSLRSIFTRAKIGASLDTLINDPAFVLCGGEMCEADVEYVGHGGVRKKMRFACEFATKPTNTRGLFVVGVPASE